MTDKEFAEELKNRKMIAMTIDEFRTEITPRMMDYGLKALKQSTIFKAHPELIEVIEEELK